MNRKLKVIGLAIAAVMALAAFLGPAAAAEFHSEVAHTQISGSQIGSDSFTGNAGTWKCSELTYIGTQATEATSSEITATPKFGGCTAFGFIGATIDVNGCDYRFTPNANPYLHIVCPTKPIEVTTATCTITFPAQTVNSGVTYTNERAGTTRDLRVKFSMTGLSYTQDNKAFPNCPGGAGTFSNGTYSGEATIKGANTAATQVGIWWA
jgi:hypothetical protein